MIFSVRDHQSSETDGSVGFRSQEGSHVVDNWNANSLGHSAVEYREKHAAP